MARGVDLFLERNSNLNRKLRNTWAVIGLSIFVYGIMFMGSGTYMSNLLLGFMFIAFLIALFHYVLFILGEKNDVEDNHFLSLSRQGKDYATTDHPTLLRAKIKAFNKHR